MPVRPGPFYVSELAVALARLPGRLEFDRDEADHIAYDMLQARERGDFADEEVVARYGDPALFVPISQIPEEPGGLGPALAPEFIRKTLWYAAVALTYPAAKRYIERCGLAGAARLLAEWFDEAKETGPPGAGKTGVAPPRRGTRPTLRNSIAAKMLEDLRSGKRTADQLRRDTLAALAAQYGGSQNTANAARRRALSKFQSYSANQTEKS
jgi:hypothetical protein